MLFRQSTQERQFKYVQNTIVADHYGNTPEMDLITSDALVNEIVGSARAV